MKAVENTGKIHRELTNANVLNYHGSLYHDGSQ